ncbi:efflux RND transporter periplasmic adaptor subunit [Cyanobium sp. CH-040]|uniref:HlyD family secretion protein n=1 Tax=Cyanobium sp. CH-040 TaxID=2823708 RepID=UPI0020CF8F82|nr:HlyD family efflux transporter periplasmic adaptor subunit [Cyanobium sp. CH-040]MCP9928805.1 efflux RND transporter periplasmic adaptor subunit [Cyanobium sp. CH-040]
MRRIWLPIALASGLALAAVVVVRQLHRQGSAAFASGNGRLEAVDVDVAARTAGRLLGVEVREGDRVRAGQVLARMDTAVLEAELRQGRAELASADAAIASARSRLAQSNSQAAATRSVIAQQQAELTLARKRHERSSRLLASGAITQETFDTDRARLQTAEAALVKARNDAATAQEAITSAAADLRAASAARDAAMARIERIEADLEETLLRAPTDARVQIRIAEPGEVLPSGGKVLNLLDLSDVFMTFYLPAPEAGRLRLGDEARLVLDAAPDLVIPARVTYVASQAQFTPKTVETRAERQTLMFRIKASLDPQLVQRYERGAKIGMPGVAWVRLDPAEPWPDRLQVRLPAQP